MIKKIGMVGAALATMAGATVAATPAQAQYYGRGYDRSYSDRGYYGRAYDRSYSDRGSYGDRSYDQRRTYDGYYGRGYQDGRRYYDGRRYSYRCRSNGTTGTVLGAIVGGLLGDAAVGRRGDGTAGAIVGAGVGALAGRAVERSGNRC